MEWEGICCTLITICDVFFWPTSVNFTVITTMNEVMWKWMKKGKKVTSDGGNEGYEIIGGIE